MPGPLSLPRGALTRLRRSDLALGRLIDRIGPFQLTPASSEGPLDALARAIVHQQLSGKAAATIYGRFRALFPGPFPSARAILDVDDERLRGCGLSGQKLSYLRGLCAQVDAGALEPGRLGELSDDGVIERLTSIKGLGVWSAQMFLIFELGRLDVWPHDDLGVRKGLAALRGDDDPPTPAETRRHGERYKPYRTVVTWYLWRSLDPPASEG